MTNKQTCALLLISVLLIGCNKHVRRFECDKGNFSGSVDEINNKIFVIMEDCIERN